MLVKQIIQQGSFADPYIEEALKSHQFLYSIHLLIEEIPDTLQPFISLYEQDRLEREIDTESGKPTAPIETVLRMILLKYIYQTSYRETENRTKTDMAWKGFAKLGMEAPVPNYSTIKRWEAFFGEESIRELHDKIMALLGKKKIVKGKKMQTDTTVVPANVHYPTDNNLMFDCINFVKRTYQEATGKTSRYLGSVQKEVKRKILDVAKVLKRRTGKAKEEVKKITETVSVLIEESVAWVEKHVTELNESLNNAVEMSRKIVAQTKKVLNNEKVEDRIVSISQDWVRPIKKGKLGVNCEFGKKLRLSEVENGIVSDWAIHRGNPADSDLILAAVEAHIKQFGKAPNAVAGDRGFWSGGNETALKEAGVKEVSIPKRGKKSKERTEHEKRPKFVKLQRWRAGGEATISHLKRNFGLGKSRAKTEKSYDICIGWGIVCRNLKIAAIKG